jgi:signal transduction histidine kinase
MGTVLKPIRLLTEDDHTAFPRAIVGLLANCNISVHTDPPDHCIRGCVAGGGVNGGYGKNIVQPQVANACSLCFTPRVEGRVTGKRRRRKLFYSSRGCNWRFLLRWAIFCAIMLPPYAATFTRAASRAPATFHPSRIVNSSFIPRTVLTDFRLSGNPVPIGSKSPLKKSITYIDSITLSQQQNIFSIEFSALSYFNSETNRYRYRLDGLDDRWHEVGSDQRTASYTTLPASTYIFDVQGATSRGKWSEPGATLRIEILPAWYQTFLFRGVCVLVFLMFFWSVYQLRLKQLERQFNTALEARVDERTRIARELHDTLLQSFHGLMFRFQAVRNMLPRRPEEAMQALDGALERTEQAIAEGREAIRGLRASTVVTNELAQAVTALGNKMSHEPASQDSAHGSAKFHVVVEGSPRNLHPILRDEIYAIAREVLRNAFRHAYAHHIEAEIRYSASSFQLRIRDDGKGIDPRVLAEGRTCGLEPEQARRYSCASLDRLPTGRLLAAGFLRYSVRRRRTHDWGSLSGRPSPPSRRNRSAGQR